MKLSILITNHETPELLALCLKSIKNTLKNIDYEIIVLDSESNEKTKEILWFEIKLISFKKNLGYSKIVNTGLKQAKGEYVLILNADIVVLDNAISELLKFIQENPEIGILAPQLLDFTGNIQISCFSKPTMSAILARRTPFKKTKQGRLALNKFLINDWDRKSTKSVDWVQGSAMMIRKETVDKIGLLDERFFMYFEDADWCKRFWEVGYKVVYYPKAQMAHYYHRSSKKWGSILDIVLNRYTRTHILSAIKYFLKYRNKKNG